MRITSASDNTRIHISRYGRDPSTGMKSSTALVSPRQIAVPLALAVLGQLCTASMAPCATLSVQLPGNGSGYVTSSPAGITCPGTCYHEFNGVTLYAAPAADSLFSSWGGACEGLENCALTLSSAATVTALFTPKASSATVSGSYYGALQRACDTTAADGTVMVVAQEQPGDLTLTRDIALTIKGGYDSGFGSNDATYTTVEGALTLAAGTTTLENLAIGQAVDAPPSAPGNVAATFGNGQVSLTWDAVSGATSYVVYYGSVSGVNRASGVKVTGTSSPSLVISGLINNSTYYFVVTAVNANGESVESAQIQATPVLSTAINTTPYAVSVAETASSYNTADLVSSITFAHEVFIDFTAGTVRLDAGETQTITSEGVTFYSSSGSASSIARTTYGLTITSTVAANIKYNLSGTLAGTLSVASSSPYELYLDNATIAATAGPALDLESSQKVYIVSAPGTVNGLTDSTSRSMTMKAALYGKGPMVFSGNGTLNVNGSYKHGIFSNDYIRIREGTLNVTVSAKDAIRSVNGFIYDDGTLTVSATGTTTGDESKGIKVEGSETTGTGKGFIVINGGHLTVNSVGKAITAGWDIDEDATTTATSDDPTPYVIINNGVITVTTTGTPYEYVSNGVTVSCSPEGIEAKSDLTINDGYITINTTDDGINAGKSITLNGGYIYSASSNNDAIDSNGVMNINGGVIVAVGSAIPEAAFDCDQNTFTITGGTFVGIAGSTSTPTASVCRQNTAILGSGTAGTTLALKSAAGATAFAFAIPKSYSTMLLSSPNIATGTRYTVYTGGTASGDKLFNGMYLGSLGYTGGSAGTSFTVSSCVTNVGGGGK